MSMFAHMAAPELMRVVPNTLNEVDLADWCEAVDRMEEHAPILWDFYSRAPYEEALEVLAMYECGFTPTCNHVLREHEMAQRLIDVSDSAPWISDVF